MESIDDMAQFQLLCGIATALEHNAVAAMVLAGSVFCVAVLLMVQLAMSIAKEWKTSQWQMRKARRLVENREEVGNFTEETVDIEESMD